MYHDVEWLENSMISAVVVTNSHLFVEMEVISNITSVTALVSQSHKITDKYRSHLRFVKIIPAITLRPKGEPL